MICLGVALLGSNLFGTLWVSWVCVSFSFTRLGKFSVITSSTRCSILVCFLLLLVFSWWTFLHFVLSKMFLKLSSFFYPFFSCSAWVFFLPCLPNHWFNPLLHLTYYLFLSVYCILYFWLVLFLWFLCLTSCCWVSL